MTTPKKYFLRRHSPHPQASYEKKVRQVIEDAVNELKQAIKEYQTDEEDA